MNGDNLSLAIKIYKKESIILNLDIITPNKN
jgi:hypothetical protein